MPLPRHLCGTAVDPNVEILRRGYTYSNARARLIYNCIRGILGGSNQGHAIRYDTIRTIGIAPIFGRIVSRIISYRACIESYRIVSRFFVSFFGFLFFAFFQFLSAFLAFLLFLVTICLVY